MAFHLVRNLLIGDSVASSVGNGAVMFISTVPDAPLSLVRLEATSTTTSIGISWQDGLYNGGLVVQDYKVSFD